jgi:CubicO group peptidase (beta-lactamase class C family)
MSLKGCDEYNMDGYTGVYGRYEKTICIDENASGYASLNFKALNDPSFSYGTASGTKGFTAASIIRLISEGKLSLHESVKKVLGKEAGKLDWLDASITVEMLLSHTADVPEYFDERVMDDFSRLWVKAPNYSFTSPKTFLPLIRRAAKSRKDNYANIGRFSYSNSGFVILAMVVEAVSGEAFNNYVSENIFRSFGMSRSGFWRFDEIPKNGTVKADACCENGRLNIYSLPIIGGGDGGAYTNPKDMALFWNHMDPDISQNKGLAGLVDQAWTIPNRQKETDWTDHYYGLGFWLLKNNPRCVFLEGYDPGVIFMSIYNRDNKRSLTIALNDECSDIKPFLDKYSNWIVG